MYLKLWIADNMCEDHNAVLRHTRGPSPEAGAGAPPLSLYTGRSGAINHVGQLTYDSTQSVVIRYLGDQEVNTLREGSTEGGTWHGWYRGWYQGWYMVPLYARHIVEVKIKGQVKGYIQREWYERGTEGAIKGGIWHGGTEGGTEGGT